MDHTCPCIELSISRQPLAQRKTIRRKMFHWLFLSVCAVTAAIFAALIAFSSPYQGWDYGDPETAVLGVAFHSFEWMFVRLAPMILIAAIVGVFLTRKKG